MFVKAKAALLPLWAVLGLPLLPLLPLAAFAQTAAPAPTAAKPSGVRPDPADAQAAVPPVRYVSPLHAYQGQAETPVAPWRASNDQVRQRGGWRSYARESAAPDVAAPAARPAAAAAAASAANGGHTGHAGHEMK